MKGEGVEKDPTEGVGWYRKAADLGHTDAMVELGNAYHNGEGVGKDLNEAFRWNRKAAEGGNSVGMLDIGIQYDTGEGVTKDSIEAARWYRKAADLGHPAAMFLLANSYHMGIGVEKNVSDAFRWYRKAAEAGNTEGMFFAAGFYHEGTGVEKDINEALRWYRKAADAGHAGAMFNLGVHYERGDGVHKDVAEAVRWYRKAVEAGNTRAMLNLGLLYFKGEGVAQDLGEADRWYRKAAAAGDTNAMEALRTLQQVKEDWDNMLVLSDGRHVAVGENGEFKVYKSMADLDPVKLTGAAKEEAKRLLNERQTRAGNGAPSAVPAQPATSSSSGPAWANSYRNAKFITYAELLKRVGPVHLTIRGSDVVSKVVPNLEDLVKTSAAEHGWKLVSEATDFELVVTANIFGSQINSQQPGFTQIYTISMGIGLRTTANCRRGDKFVRLTVQPYRSYTYYCGAMGDLSDLTRGYAKAFSSCINTLFNGMAEMTDADSKDDEAAWTASLWPPAKDAEMQKNFLAPVQGDPNGSESAFHGITNFALRPVKLVDKAGNYLDARSVEEAWATELSRNGQAIDQSSDARIVDDIGTYWESLSPLGRQGFYMNYCTVNVWQKNVVFKVNGELRRGTVHIWGAEKVVMALPEQQSSEWNLANLSIPLLAKQFALGRLAGGEASDAQTNPQKQEARTAAAQEEAQRLEAEQPQQRETQEQGTKTEALVRAERQSKQDARKAAQAFDQALQRNDMASASSLALGSEKELLAAKAQYDLMQAFARLQLARGKKFGGNQATAPFDPDWKKTDEHLDGEKATVSNGPIIFKTQRVGQTWKVDVRGLDAATSPEALVLSQRLVKDVNEIEAKVERGEYKSEKEVQEGLEAKVAAAAGSGQASSPAIAHSGNDSVQSSRPRSEDSLAVERYLRSQLVGGMTERQIVELSDLIADKINKAGFSTKERGYLFRGTGDQRQFNMLALDGLKRGEQTPAFTKAAAKQLDREINEMFPVRAVFKRPIWPWKALPPIEEPIHQAPWTPGSLVSEHLETFDGAIHQLAEHAIKVEQGYSGKSPKGYAQQVQNLQAGDVLCCKYEGDDGESWSYPYYFWYKEAPPGLQELLKTLPPDHPIRLIGPPLTQAPATLTLAKNANQATAEAAVKKGAPDERAQLDSVLDSRGVDPQLAKLLRPYFHKAADAAHARRADSERIVKSGGAKMLCPKCDGYKLISRRYYDSSRNPYSWGDPMYSIYESQRNGVSFENCDVCGGTGVIR
jgi:TPR repeat protein